MLCSKVEDLLNKIQENNQMFSEEQLDLLKNITNSQHPKITLITCSDSRVNMDYFKTETLDKIFTIRNIGNVILTSEGSIDYGVEHLETPILFILGHTNCGAVKAAIKDYDECTPDIKRELDHLMPALVGVQEKDFKKKWLKGVEKNLELQMNIAENKFKNKIENKKLIIIGGILDIDNSYGEGLGKIHIKKIIGETNCDLGIDF